MPFIEARFPDDPSYGATGGEMFKTSIGEVDSGYEYRNQNWSLGKIRYEIGLDARQQDKFLLVRNFYKAMKGRFYSFRYKDWADFTATDTEGIFGIIDSTHFQLYKQYEIPPVDSSGPDFYNRKITKPVNGTLTITGGVVMSIDYTTGIVTMTSGTPTAWAGEFDVPVRFDTDAMQASIITREGGHAFMYSWSSIVLLEVRE